MKVAALALALIVSVQAADPVQQTGAAADPAERALLVNGQFVEALAEAAIVPLDRGSSLNLEPGIRFTRFDGAYAFASHDGNKVEIEIGTERLSLASPVTALLTDRGWEFNGSKPVQATSLTARRRQAQDDSDSNLKSMQEAAKKLNDKAPQSSRKARVRWLYGENPFATAELFNTAAIQQLSHISPAGF